MCSYTWQYTYTDIYMAASHKFGHGGIARPIRPPGQFRWTQTRTLADTDMARDADTDSNEDADAGTAHTDTEHGYRD